RAGRLRRSSARPDPQRRTRHGWLDLVPTGSRSESEEIAEPRPPFRPDLPEREGTESAADTDQALGEHDHRDHEHRAEEDVTKVAEPVLLPEHLDRDVDPGDPEHTALEPLRDEDVEGRTQHGTPARVDTSDDQDHEDRDAEVDVERVGVREALDVHEDRTGSG